MFIEVTNSPQFVTPETMPEARGQFRKATYLQLPSCQVVHTVRVETELDKLQPDDVLRKLLAQLVTVIKVTSARYSMLRQKGCEVGNSDW